MSTILRLLLLVLYRVKLEGTFPRLTEGSVLIIANHPSRLDSVLLGLFLPVKPVVVVSREEHKSSLWLRLALRAIPHIFAEMSDPLGARRIVKLLDDGHSVALFPEGRVTRTGSFMKVYEVPALIAAKSGAAILPVFLDGPEISPFGCLGGRYRKKLFPRITLHMQPTTRMQNMTEGSARLRRHNTALRLRQIIQTTRVASRPKHTLFDALLASAARYGLATPIIEDTRGTQDSYKKLIKTSLALGRGLCRFSKEDEAVGVLLPNISTTVAVVFGLSAMGRVVAMLNYTAGGSTMRKSCVAANVKTVITSRRFLEAAKLAATVKLLQDIQLIYLEDYKSWLSLRDKLWLLTYAFRWPHLAAKRKDPNGPAVVLFTSGSEGQPKGVVLSHSALLCNVVQIQSVMDFSSNDKFFNALPMYHAYGLTGCTLLPLLGGSQLYLYPSPLHYRVIPEVVYRKDCTCIFGTSAFLRQYAQTAHAYDFYSARYVISGGEKLHSEVADLWLRKFGVRVLEGYGAAECAPVIALNVPLAYKEGCVGNLMPGIEYHIRPTPGIARGGVLHVRGPNLMLGYYLFDEPGILKPPQSEVGDGWHNTGDVVEVDEEGFIFVKGRIKRFAKVAGEMVSLELVEKMAGIASPLCLHAATVYVESQSGEVFVLFTTDPDLTRIVLMRAAKQLNIPELALPHRIVYMKDLPLLGIGKIDYVNLKSQAEFTHRDQLNLQSG